MTFARAHCQDSIPFHFVLFWNLLNNSLEWLTWCGIDNKIRYQSSKPLSFTYLPISNSGHVISFLYLILSQLDWVNLRIEDGICMYLTNDQLPTWFKRTPSSCFVDLKENAFRRVLQCWLREANDQLLTSSCGPHRSLYLFTVSDFLGARA